VTNQKATELRLSDKAETRIEEVKALYPDQRSAVMAALYIAQEELGYVSKEAIEWVSRKVDMAPVHVQEVATFYTMYYKKPVAKYHIQLCRTLSCALRGMKDLSKTVHEKLKVAPGEITSDGLFSFEEVECLGSCGTGPMCQINDRFFENLDAESLLKLIDKIAKEQPNLSLSTVNDSLGEGLPEAGFSQLK
jgi:NADH-quinone oxidoreductase E subunit